ncbi:MAG: hypothetical protein K9L30_07060 [Desulfobacterales bacterium]|nr:hypothetical protein [Desulfobacterales bacterium]
MTEPITADQIEEALFDFIKSKLVAPGVDFDSDTKLADIGIDSISLVELLLFLERSFSIRIPDSDLTRKNLLTINTLAVCASRYESVIL